MSFRKPAVLIISFLLLAAISFAQDVNRPSDPAKANERKELEEKVVQILDQVIADASFLRLPQNKAIVYAMAADQYWKFDEKKSRELFRTAANEVISYNFETEREKRESTEPLGDQLDFNDPRGQVLQLVGARDAELALELLIQTRSAALAEALLTASTPEIGPEGTNVPNFNPARQRARQEILLEQGIALMAANSNPDRAIKMIKDSLSKGVSYNVLPLLQKLHQKEEKKAADLAGEVIKKIIDTDIAKNPDEFQVALNFLQFMGRSNVSAGSESKSKIFTFTDTQSRDLANKLAAIFLQPSNSNYINMSLPRALSNLEKFVPEKIAQLKQKQAANQRSLPAGRRNTAQTLQVFNPNSTPEEILAAVPKITNARERAAAYQFAAGRIAQIDDESRAKKLIDQIPDEKVRSSAMEQLENARISRAAATGRLEDAEKLVAGLSNKRLQVRKLVSLAQSYVLRGSETDIEAAKGIMKSARALVNEIPEDEDDLNNLMEIVKGYAAVEPDIAFRIFEPFVDEINDNVQASAVLSKYSKRSRTFKSGELLLKTMPNPNDGILLFRYFSQIQLLGQADLPRMNSLADRLQRPDSRLLVKLLLVQGSSMNAKRPRMAASGPNTATPVN